jgi:flagellar hook assembly protein FlgD
VQLQPDAPSEDALVITPSPFSPDGDGFDDATRIRFDLTSDIASVRVRIYDARGRLVRTLEESRLVGRTGELIWDGRGDDGQTLRIGIYIVLFEALDTAGGRVVTMKRPAVLAHPLD